MRVRSEPGVWLGHQLLRRLEGLRDKWNCAHRLRSDIESGFQPCAGSLRLGNVGGVDARQHVTGLDGFPGFGQVIHSDVVVDT